MAGRIRLSTAEDAFTDPVAQVTRPVRALLAFAKVQLEPGEEATVRFVQLDRLGTGQCPGVPYPRAYGEPPVSGYQLAVARQPEFLLHTGQP
ncbi:fibronectin type III-like domain-contianing protein [Streptomyces sp. NPDC054834]